VMSFFIWNLHPLAPLFLKYVRAPANGIPAGLQLLQCWFASHR
jgi:hypothetical protein